MENRPILFLDSGIGGIPYCRNFHQKAENESIVYIADRQYFPYGERERAQIIAILSQLVEKAIQAFNPKIAVLACNTATIAALPELRKQFPALPFVGTVPAVKPAAMASHSGKIGVLGTAFTVSETYINELAAKYGGAQITGIAAGELVDFIESRYLAASAEEKEAAIKGYIDRFRAAGADSLVLGCTHFLFLQQEFRRLASPDIMVFESVAGITQRIESLLLDNSFANMAPNVKNRLVLTGVDEPEPSWAQWADYMGFELSLLEQP